MDDDIRQQLLGRFAAWLEAAGPALPEADAEADADAAQTADLYSVFVELAGLRSEVRTESRLVKDALDQFRSAFDTLQASHASVQRDLDRARAESREAARTALRPLLLDIIDLRDRLAAALKVPTAAPLPWPERLWRQPVAQADAWQEGLRMTLRRFDQVLRDRGVQAMPLLGAPLDPRLARVVGTAAGDAAPGIVIEEVRGGFMWDEHVLRTAEVIVSAGPANRTSATPIDDGERP